MLSAFLPGLGNGAAAPLVSGGGAGLGPLSGLSSLSSAALTPGSPGLVQTSSSPGLCSECKLVEVHGVKVASFSVDGQELICLPQVFDLFLKHLVGGLHTVYTKLKRLDITPVVCTVEQVRVLRGLGAIQPGVNRCKLISRKDFETLYQDCTSARWVHTNPTFTTTVSAQVGATFRRVRACVDFHLTAARDWRYKTLDNTDLFQL